MSSDKARSKSIKLNFTEGEYQAIKKIKPEGISMGVWLRKEILSFCNAKESLARPVILTSSQIVEISVSLIDSLKSLKDLITRIEERSSKDRSWAEKQWESAGDKLKNHVSELRHLGDTWFKKN